MREDIPDAVLTGVKENAVHSFSGLVLDPKKAMALWETNGYQWTTVGMVHKTDG